MNNSDHETVEAKESNKSFLEINQQAFTELLTFVDFVDEKLNIGFVEVNFAQDRDILIEALIKHKDCQNIQFEVLNFPDPDLRFLRDELVAELKELKVAPDKKLVLLITGLEKSIGVPEQYPAVLTNLNFVRDDLSHSVCHPMLLFLPEYALTRLAKYAPDFWAWGRKVFYFKRVSSTLDTASDRIVFIDESIHSLDLPEKQERINLLLRLLDEYGSPNKQENKRNLPTIINIGNQLGIAYFTLGKFQKAIDYHQKSLKIAQEIGDNNGEAQSLGNLGYVYYFLGEYQKAIVISQKSLKIAQEIGDHNREANSLRNLGIYYSSQGEYQQAIDYFQKSLEITQKIGDQYGEARSLGNLGHAYYSLRKYQKAINCFQRSLKIKRTIGDRNGISNSLIGLGLVYRCQENYQLAIDFFQQSLKITQQIGDRHREASSLRNLGIVYYSLGEYQRAIDFYQKSLEITQQIGDRHGEANSLFNLGLTYKEIGQKSEAKEDFENSRQLYRVMGLDKKVEDCNKAIQDLEIG